MYLFSCGYCSSSNTERIETFKGEFVEPDDKYNDGNKGLVVRCKECGEITGYLLIITGVIKTEE